MDSLQRKGINFDLNTQALKEYYPKGDWHNAYADVRDFFEARMYLPEKRNGWKRKMHDLTNYFQYVIFISSKKGSS